MSKKKSPFQKVESVVKRYLLTAMGYSLILAIVGIFMIIFPALSLDIIRWGLVITLIGLGVYAIVSDLTHNSILTMFTGSVGGVLMLVLGIIIAMHPAILGVIPIILGVFIIVTATFSLRLSTSLRAASATGFYVSMITSVIAIVCGIMLILNPLGGSIALTTFVGIIILIYAITSFVDLAVLHSHLQELSKNLKTQFGSAAKNHKIIDAEIEEDDE